MICIPEFQCSMEYRYCTVANLSDYETEVPCDGIDLRKHDYTYLEDRGWEPRAKRVRPVSRYREALGAWVQHSDRDNSSVHP